MKTNYTIKILIWLSILFCFTISLNAQIRFVQVDPATETITIKNFGSGTLDISSYKLCIFPSYPQLSTLTVSSGSLNLAAGAEVTVVSSTNLVDGGGELGLYINTNSFGNSANIRDYIQWINTGGTREPVAVGAMIWDTGTTIPNTVTPPYQYNGDGTTTNDGESFWGSTLSTKDFALNNFSIYPNPSQNYINLKLPKSDKEVAVNVYDIVGKQVYSNTSFNDEKINVSKLNTGIYLIKVSVLGKIKTKRFIKQ